MNCFSSRSSDRGLFNLLIFWVSLHIFLQMLRNSTQEVLCMMPEYLINDEDKDFLLAIYLYRCLNLELAASYLYHKHLNPQLYAEKRVLFLTRQGLILEREGAYFLTTIGVNHVKKWFEKQLMARYKPGKEDRVLPKSCDLKICDRNVNHQLHLNKFAMELQSYAPSQVPYCYYDEKFMPAAGNFIMPDGMFEIPKEILFFEMDMGTESTKRLAQKWDSYRTFLNDPKSYYAGKKISMFFIIEGITQPLIRARNVITHMFQFLGDRFSNHFDCFINTPENCHEIIKSKFFKMETELQNQELICKELMMKHWGFMITKPDFFTSLSGTFSYYARKLSDKKKIQILSGHPQEFILDIWLDGRLSILRNIFYWKKFSAQITKHSGRNIFYLIIVPSEAWLLLLVKRMKLAIPKGICFSTVDRLRGGFSPKSLFTIDSLLNIVHFTDFSYSSTVHEKRPKTVIGN